MIEVSIAGSTGSVGTQALEVIGANSDRFSVAALSANSSVQMLASQANAYRPKVVAISNPKGVKDLKALLNYEPSIIAGDDVADSLSEVGDVVLNAVVGFAGLKVTISTLEHGRRLALANKESLVAAGDLVAKIRSANGGEIVPVDSEHSAIHQALRSSFFGVDEVSKLILTASGGPFRGKSIAYLNSVKLQDALDHPTWSMGPKISIDSSTLMNKGLEVIEAHELFGVDYDRIEVVVHPQSIVHSIVEFTDGSALAQISGPDMRLPIGYALAYPSRVRHSFGALDWKVVRNLEFESPDLGNFPSLALAYEVGRRGGGAPTWLNGSNEVAVEAFLAGKIRWMDIFKVVERSLSDYNDIRLDDIETVMETDRHSRLVARGIVDRL